MALVVIFTSAPTIQVSDVLTTPTAVEQFTIVADVFSIHEPPPSHSPIKRTQCDNPLTSIGEGSFKRARLSEGTEQEDLTPFFQLLDILPYQVPSTLEEFVVMDNEDLVFLSKAYLQLTGEVSLQMFPILCLGPDP